MGHWYDTDGEPRHYEGKDGAGTTLREARKLGLYPSVTTVGGILHKQALVNWLQEQAAMTAGMLVIAEGLDGLDIDQKFAQRAIAEAREKVTEKADAGTDIHDILERYMEDPFSCSKEDRKLCHAVEACIHENTGLSLFDDFEAEARFCDTEVGYAGMCDLHTPPASKCDKWVIDYKTKDKVDEKTRAYPEQAEQLVAYSHGLGIPDARVANLFIPRTPDEDGNYNVKFCEHKDTLMAWARFVHACYLWQVTKKYGPYYERMVGGES